MKENSIITLFFDLPTKTSVERKEYRKFVRLLIQEGYARFQESIFYKQVLNRKLVQYDINFIKSISPRKGNIKVLPLTELQFSSIINVKGDELSLDKRRIIEI